MTRAATALAIALAGCAGKGEAAVPADATTEDSTAVEADAVADWYDGFDPPDTEPPEARSPPFDCPPAYYYVGVDLYGGHWEFTHNALPHSVFGYTNDTPGYWRQHMHTVEDVIYGSSVHGGVGDAVFMAWPYSGIFIHIGSDFRSSVNSPDMDPSALVLTFTRKDPIGGIVEGTYEGDVAEHYGDGGLGPISHASGSFRLCHLPDSYLPD